MRRDDQILDLIYDDEGAEVMAGRGTSCFGQTLALNHSL